MDPLIAALSHVDATSLATVVHVGAGDGRHIAAYRARKVRRLVLVEGDSQLHPSLRAAAQGQEGVEVLADAIGAGDGEGRWHRFSVRRLNGLHGPGEVQQVYPGLRQTAAEAVPVRTLADLLASVAASAITRPTNLLVLDLPGPLCDLLAAVPEPLFDAFGWVFVRGPQRALLAGADTADAVQEWLRQRHFAAAWTDTRSDPLWASHLLRLDTTGRQLASLRARLKEREVQVEGLESAQRQLQQTQAELRQKRSELTQRVATLELELRSQAESLTRVREQLKTASERAKAAEQAELLAKQRNEQIVRLRKELEDTRQTALATSRLNLLHDAELRDLQARYETIQREHATQQALLSRLEAHVAAAAQHTRELEGGGLADTR